jgi:hypothetical protein
MLLVFLRLLAFVSGHFYDHGIILHHIQQQQVHEPGSRCSISTLSATP